MSNRPILDYFETDEVKPKLYSRELIVGFTLVFSVLFGAILYVHNLRAVGKRRTAVWITTLAVAYHALIWVVMPYFDDLPFLPSLLVNLFAGLLLAGPLWKRQIGSISFQSKSPLYPLLFAILIALGWLVARQTAYGLI